MKILITSGGTTEKIDDVRGITNHSTGYLGKEIAELFLAKGHQVTLVTVKTAGLNLNQRKSKDKQKLPAAVSQKMEPLVKEHDVLIHSMAVSDYTPIYMTDFAELEIRKISLNSYINLTLKARFHQLLIIRFFFLKKHRRSLASSNNGIPIFSWLASKLFANVSKEDLSRLLVQV